MAVGYALSLYCTCGAPADGHLCTSCHAQRHLSPSHAARIRQGQARARALGRHPGRPPAISDALLKTIRQALADGMSKARACHVFGVKRTTLYDALARGA